MTEYTVKLDAETVDNIIVEQLFDTRSNLLQDYMSGTNAVFDVDFVEDRRQIGELIKAIERVIDWYSVPNSVKFDELPEVKPVQQRDLGN
jgi:hypothetical protein